MLANILGDRMSKLRELMNLGVVPGDSICVIEEFMPGNGVYEDDGTIRSAIVGRVSIDFRTRFINVRPLVKSPQLPARGEIVYALVTVVHDEISISRIFSSESGKKFNNPFTALLHISQTHEKFVKNFNEVLAVGDIIKAKVLNDGIPYMITIKDVKLGVILAYCSICGTPLRKQSSDTLKCPKCGNTEKRKMSIEYGSIKARY